MTHPLPTPLADFVMAHRLLGVDFESAEPAYKPSGANESLALRIGDWSRSPNSGEDKWPRAQIMFSKTSYGEQDWMFQYEDVERNYHEQYTGDRPPVASHFAKLIKDQFPPLYPPEPVTLENIQNNTFAAARNAVLAQTRAPGPGKRVTFWVPSTPKGQDRAAPHPGQKNKRYTKTSTKTARQDIIGEFHEKVGANFRPWDGPILIEVIDCHYKKSAFYGEHCRTKPDWDNSGKLVGDALNGVAWSDDAIIISGLPQKTYWPWAGKWVRLSFYNTPEKPKTGTVKVDERNRQVLYHGVQVGSIFKVGSRYQAFRTATTCEGHDLAEHFLPDDNHESQAFRTVGEAEERIMSTVFADWNKARASKP